MHPVKPLYVVGAGGIGCAVGYALAAAGVRVVFVDADAGKVTWGRAHGVGVDRHPPRPSEFEAFADWTPERGATVLLCTKCYDNAAVLARLPSDVTLIPIQNGFDTALDPYVGSPEGIASFVSECNPHRSQTRITRAGRLHVGYRDGVERRAKRVERELPFALGALRPALRALRIRLERVPDILPYKHTKLMYNAAISPLAAAAGLDNGQLLALPQARQLFFELLRENYAILDGAGVRLGKVGPFHPATVARILRRPAVANSLAWAFYPTLRKTYCSMSGDLPRGRTEIDYYNGHLVRLAGDRPCPLNRRVYALVKRMEQERRPPGRHVLEELATDPAGRLAASVS
jgi:2-dehydropantoate 2-reductase